MSVIDWHWHGIDEFCLQFRVYSCMHEASLALFLFGVVVSAAVGRASEFRRVVYSARHIHPGRRLEYAIS